MTDFDAIFSLDYKKKKNNDSDMGFFFGKKNEKGGLFAKNLLFVVSLTSAGRIYSRLYPCRGR